MCSIQQRLLLFDAEYRHLIGHLVHHLLAGATSVARGGLSVEGDGLTEDQLVGIASERIAVHLHWVEINVGIVALRLVRGAAVKVPLGIAGETLRDSGQSARLGTQALLAVDPDVHRLHLVRWLLQRHVLLQEAGVRFQLVRGAPHGRRESRLIKNAGRGGRGNEKVRVDVKVRRFTVYTLKNRKEIYFQEV